ncbi:MAG: alkene reductase [Longimicrobiales bacterium]
MPALFDPIQIGEIGAANRIAMAPMTRSRADVMGVPSPHAAEYYGQRASGGLLITEGTQPSFGGQGYARTPGIHTADQIAAWKDVTSAVREAGGRIVCQVMHVGRIAHPHNRQVDDDPVAPSAIAPDAQMYTDEAGMQPIPTPRALETSEIPAVIEEYAQAARNAIEAGFDGVELHSASGYLPNQFLASNCNHRTDAYGGDAINRIRFTVEALEAMADAIGSGRVGIKLSPGMGFNDCLDADPVATFSALLSELNGLDLAYLHMGRFTSDFDVHGTFRPLYEWVYLAGGGLSDAAQAQELLDDGLADMTVWGGRYLANPDLPDRLKRGGPFNDPNPDTFYTPGPEGYTDYPTLSA